MISQEFLPPQFTALQIAVRLAKNSADVDLVRQRVETAPLASSLRETLTHALDNRERPALLPNAALNVEQRLLFVALLVRMMAMNDAREFADLCGYSAPEADFLLQHFIGEPIGGLKGFFDPPEQLFEAVLTASRELQLGIPSRPFVGDLSPHLYAHEWDREAIRRMQEVSGFETILRKYSEFHVERLNLVAAEASNVRVTATQFPEVREIFEEACNRAGIDRRPDFFIQMGGLNAYTAGIERPQIVLSSALVSLLTPRELLFVIGHELGHIRSDHVLYQGFARMLPTMSAILGEATLGLGRLLSSGVQLAVLDWYRKAEFTADRFGLLVCQDRDTAIRVLMKVAGAPPLFFERMSADAFIEQGRSYHFDYDDPQNKFYKFMITAAMDHPWPSVRAWQLDEWVSAGHYDRLVHYDARLQPAALAPPTIGCSTCGHQNPANGNFCESCGSSLRRSLPAVSFCTECGTTFDDHSQFCTECGAPRE